MRDRIPKSQERKLKDLDDQLFLLRGSLQKLNEDKAYLKNVSTGLRNLLCKSSGTEGLLWRLVDDFKISDSLYLHALGPRNLDHPRSFGLSFHCVPLKRGGEGDPRILPSECSFREIIENQEAVFIGGKILTHDHLIKAVAQQMGLAHEDDGLEPCLVSMSQIFINGLEHYIPVLVQDAEFALEIGERVLMAAEEKGEFLRNSRSGDYGVVSILFQMNLEKQICSQIPLFRFRSHVGQVEVQGFARPMSIAYLLKKQGKVVGEITTPYPENWENGVDAIFVFFYYSRLRQCYAMTNAIAQDQEGEECDIGWLHASDLKLEWVAPENEFLKKQRLMLFSRLLEEIDIEFFVKEPLPNE